MFIVAQHRITDPLTFWTTVQMGVPRMENRARLHQVLPNAEGTEAVCVWEADSLDSVRDMVERHLGHVSTNTYFAVEPTRAVGLPGSLAAH